MCESFHRLLSSISYDSHSNPMWKARLGSFHATTWSVEGGLEMPGGLRSHLGSKQYSEKPGNLTTFVFFPMLAQIPLLQVQCTSKFRILDFFFWPSCSKWSSQARDQI